MKILIITLASIFTFASSVYAADELIGCRLLAGETSIYEAHLVDKTDLELTFFLALPFELVIDSIGTGGNIDKKDIAAITKAMQDPKYNLDEFALDSKLSVSGSTFSYEDTDHSPAVKITVSGLAADFGDKVIKAVKDSLNSKDDDGNDQGALGEECEGN